MNSRHQTQQPSKKPISTKQSRKNDHQRVASPPKSPQATIDIDQLAKEKVEEIERALKDPNSLKLDVLNTWFSILKQIITAADLHRTNDDRNKDDHERSKKQETGDSIYADYGDDNEQFNAHMDLSEQFATNSVKWTIRVRAFKIVHRLVTILSHNNDNVKPISPVLVKLLPDMVRLAFVAATSPYDELKMQGFAMFKFLIEKFAGMEEKEFPGHSILEQYKTQVLSALKPAFNLDAPPYITAIASQICSLWICHGLEKEMADVKRTYQLMLLSIEKLDAQGVNQHSKLYTESELERERVDILGAWAQLDIASVENDLPGNQHGRLFKLNNSECSNLKSLIEPQVKSLIDKWWEALKDYALLIMPSPKFICTMHGNEHVYTREVALKLFGPIWPKLVLIQTYRLTMCHEQLDPSNSKYVRFLFGIIFRELSKYSLLNKCSKRDLQMTSSTMMTLKSLHLLVTNPKMQPILTDNLTMACEFYSILYNIIVHHIPNQSFKLLLKDSLEKLFALIFGKVSSEESCVRYAIAKLISLLMTTMKDIAIASRQDLHAELESYRIHLVIRLENLISIYLHSPRSAINESPLQEALITVFQEMLRFDLDKCVALSLADQLHHFYPVMANSDRAHFIDELYPEIANRIKTIAGVTVTHLLDSKELDKLNLIQLEAFFKTFRCAIQHSSSIDRIKLMNSYFEISSGAVRPLVAKKDQLVEERNKRDLVDFFINQVAAVEKEAPDEFSSDLLSQEVVQEYHSLIKLQSDIKREIESKNEKLLEAKKLSNAKSESKKPKAAKITLKADFSNFYATKKL